MRNLRETPLFVPIMLLVSAVIQLHRITHWSVWHDESFTLMLIDDNFSEILRRTALDVHPPLYYLVLKTWSLFAGNSEFAIRGLSVLFTLGSLTVVYFLIKELWGRRAARVSLIFLAIAPYVVRYAQEARMYAMVSFFLILGTLIIVKKVRGRCPNPLWWYVYGLLLAAAMYSHYYALFLIPVHWLYVGVSSLPEKPTKNWLALIKETLSRVPGHWWLANIFAGLLFLPWLPTAVRQFQSIQNAFWIPPVDHTTFFSTLTNFLIYKNAWEINNWHSAWMLFTVVGLIVLLVSWVKSRQRAERPGAILLLSYAFLPPIFIFLLSMPPFQPIYNNRYFSLTALMFYALLAVVIASESVWRRRYLRTGLIALTVITLMTGLSHVYTVGNFNPDRLEHYTMQELSEVITDNYKAGDAVVSTRLSTYFETRYYVERKTDATVRLLAEDGFSGIGNTSLVYDREEVLIKSYSELTPETHSVWLVTDAPDKEPKVPMNWLPLGPRFESGYAAIQKYYVVY